MGYLVIGLIKLFSLANLAFAQRIGRFIGWALYQYRNRTREVTRVNIDLAYPNLSASEKEGLVKETLQQNGMIAAEMGAMWGYKPKKTLSLLRHVHHLEVLTDALEDDRGLLLLVPHIGNWEIVNNFLTTQTPATAMYRPAKMKSFNHWMTSRRSATGIHLVPTSRAGVERLFAVLEQGGCSAVLPDQEPKRAYGVFAPFMGIPTLTPKLPFELIQSCRPRVVFAFAERLPDHEGFDIHFLKPDDSIYDENPEVATTELNRMIELCVEKAPAQYQWTYKRFKSRPEKGTNPYKVANVP